MTLFGTTLNDVYARGVQQAVLIRLRIYRVLICPSKQNMDITLN